VVTRQCCRQLGIDVNTLLTTAHQVRTLLLVKNPRTTSTDNDLITPSEVADLLRLPLQTIYGWRHRRQGPPAMRVGRHLRYRRRDVEAWLDARKEEQG